jgi:hypothetical protein
VYAKKSLAGATLTIVAVTAGAASAKDQPAQALQVFSAAADTYVTAARPAANYGRSLSLKAAGAPQTTTFLRFDLKNPASSEATVILLLHAQSGRRASYQVRRVTEKSWRERRLTFVNAPKLSNRYTAGKQKRQGAWNAIDVTAFVAGNARASLAVTSRSPNGLVFHSRESKLGPRLVVQTGSTGQIDIKGLLPLP